MVKIEPVFKVRVVYKSGYVHDFECSKFRITPGKEAEWFNANDSNKPLQIGIDEIAAVWQIGLRHRLAWSKQ